MEKRYTEMNLKEFWGMSLEKIVYRLLEHRKEGRLVSAYFNGVMLYSDVVTMDDAYLQVVGKSKAEFDAYLEEKLEINNHPQKE